MHPLNGDYFYVNWQIDLPAFSAEHINVKEFLTIFIALCRWCGHLCNKKVIIYSDNKSAVSWINKGTSHNMIVMFACRLLLWFSASFNCSIKAIYLRGRNNVRADTCSRLHDPDKFSLLYCVLPSLTYQD